MPETIQNKLGWAGAQSRLKQLAWSLVQGKTKSCLFTGWVKNLFYQKKILGHEKILVESFFGKIFFSGHEIFLKKIFWVKKNWSKKFLVEIFCVENFFVMKLFSCPKFFFCRKFFGGRKNFLGQKIFGSKIFWAKIFLDDKSFWV